MRTTLAHKLSLLALFAGVACACTPAVGALADATGGAAPTPATTTGPKVALATWFGPGFYGHKTACGQVLSRALVGVANRTLPCGTLVQVNYRGHSLTVPVVDRGPYANGADWDLTGGAARALKIKETVRVATLVVGSEPNTPTLGLPPGATVAGGAAAGAPAPAAPSASASSAPATGGASAG